MVNRIKRLLHINEWFWSPWNYNADSAKWSAFEPCLSPVIVSHISSRTLHRLQRSGTQILLSEQCQSLRWGELAPFRWNKKTEANLDWAHTRPLQMNFPWTYFCTRQLGKNPLNSSFAWFKVAEFGLSSFLGPLDLMPYAEVLSITWQGASPSVSFVWYRHIGNKLRSYACSSFYSKKFFQVSFWIINQQRFIIKNLYANLCSVLSLNQPHYIKTLALKHEVKCKRNNNPDCNQSKNLIEYSSSHCSLVRCPMDSCRNSKSPPRSSTAFILACY